MKLLTLTTALSLSLFATASLVPLAAAQTTPLPQSSDVTTQQSTLLTDANADGTYSEIKGDHVLGSPAAPISMIIYASVTCPHCASWFNSIWPGIKKTYVATNKLRVVFREFPTNPAPNIAVIGFQIANCAPEDQYFKMIEHQMTERDNIFVALEAGKGKEKYLEISKKAGLPDEAAMNACLQEQEGLDQIYYSVSLAQKANISSAPSFIINGEIYKQGSNYLPLSKHLNKLLAQEYSPIRKP